MTKRDTYLEAPIPETDPGVLERAREVVLSREEDLETKDLYLDMLGLPRTGVAPEPTATGRAPEVTRSAATTRVGDLVVRHTHVRDDPIMSQLIDAYPEAVERERLERSHRRGLRDRIQRDIAMRPGQDGWDELHVHTDHTTLVIRRGVRRTVDTTLLRTNHPGLVDELVRRSETLTLVTANQPGQ